jgi:thiol-disulfide isomerase/thioredoxin
MSESPAEPGKEQGKARGGFLGWALAGLAVIVVAAAVYVMLSGRFKPPGDLKSLTQGSMAKLTVAAQPVTQPDTAFQGPDGKTLHISDFKGQVVVVNLWATWCGPCKAEMPSLAKLQGLYAQKPLKVVAISVDRPEDADLARAFLKQHGGLDLYQDPKYAMAFSLTPRAEGVPTTVIFGRDGREVARLSGGAEWSTPEARKVMDAVLAQPG